MAKKKYTRKELKQPDEFISASNKAWEWLNTHVKGVLVGVGVFLLIVGAATIWRNVVDGKAKAGTAQLSKAIEIYNQAVIPGAKTLPPADDGTPRFATQKAKLAAAEKELSAAITKHAGLKTLALLLRAGVYLDQSQFDKARKDYEQFLSTFSGGPAALRTAAIEGLVYAQEGRKDWAQALKAVARLPKAGDARYAALYHEGRILAAQGKTKEATERFKTVSEKAKSRLLLDQAGQRLAALGAK